MELAIWFSTPSRPALLGGILGVGVLLACLAPVASAQGGWADHRLTLAGGWTPDRAPVRSHVSILGDISGANDFEDLYLDGFLRAELEVEDGIGAMVGGGAHLIDDFSWLPFQLGVKARLADAHDVSTASVAGNVYIPVDDVVNYAAEAGVLGLWWPDNGRVGLSGSLFLAVAFLENDEADLYVRGAAEVVFAFDSFASKAGIDFATDDAHAPLAAERGFVEIQWLGGVYLRVSVPTESTAEDLHVLVGYRIDLDQS